MQIRNIDWNSLMGKSEFFKKSKYVLNYNGLQNSRLVETVTDYN